ncbi:MAG: serine/threonine protein kinase [Alphaproteobacteria bacterium]|nr:serine/threonine protein kinase [Alphaproteobacteria bacterium]MBF0391245.1 serine/threonine protein kinase [Alphaproteobacteria bacterium]
MIDMPSRNALPKGYSFHRYRIEAVLGDGGFGITYLAVDLTQNRQVAIKEYFPAAAGARKDGATVVPRGSQDDSMYRWGLRRFLDEAMILARLSHGNIVRVLRLFEANQTAYIVMPYECGYSLGAFFSSSEPPLDERELLSVLLPIASGLEAVHKADLLHRDIKPGNVFIREDGSPVLLDFGAARQSVGRKSQSVNSLITPGYSPLEQYSVRDDKQGPWTDIYAFCALAYTAIAGKAPIPANDRAMAVNDRKGDPLIPARAAGRQRFSAKLLYAVDRGLALVGHDRPQSIGEWRSLVL